MRVISMSVVRRQSDTAKFNRRSATRLVRLACLRTLPRLPRTHPMNSVEPSGFRRREFLKQTTAAALLGGMGAGSAAMAATRGASSTLIADENRRPGALDWQLSRVRLTKKQGIRASAVE